ncbi:MAG TPA: ABC transporter permease [Pyrinomonadaceae bacterium]|nr:ABC transporter permease [Pyrinomonadaceae bacterium]
MRKFLAVVKREYLQRVRSKMFIVFTVLGPLMLAFFGVLPPLIMGMKTGESTRIAIVDETDRLYPRVYKAIMAGHEDTEETNVQGKGAINPNPAERTQKGAGIGEEDYSIRQENLDGRSIEEVKRDLSERVRRNQLDAFIILPRDILQSGKAEYYGRNTGDIFTRGRIADYLSRAVREQRLADEHIDESRVRALSSPVEFQTQKITETGEETDAGAGFYVVFGVGFVIYISILLYGQVMLAAVIEEKETRIAEILFSSIRSFPLMMGKLIGVSLVALTQLSIWGLAFGAFAIYGVSALAARGLPIHLPHVPAITFIYFLLFFLMGYFIYATIYALVGSMVTTTQEGGQVALPVIVLLVIGFYLAFPVIRSPNSPLAFWASMFPFFSPITMLVRIVAQQPPAWQILLSLGIGAATIVLLVWIASRIYRVGMLMYGKRASIPEVLRWIRQA